MGFSILDQSPFYHRGPIQEREFFFGRKPLINDTVLFLLEHGQSVAIVGKKKIGKSSFLVHVANSETVAQATEIYGFVPGDHAFVFVDCEAMRELDDADCFRLIREALKEQVLSQIESLALGLEDIRPSESYAELCSALRMLKMAKIRPVIQLDDLDCIANNSRISRRFLDGLRALVANYDVCYLASSMIPLDELEHHDTRYIGSPFFNVFLSYELPAFKPAESRKLLNSRLTSAGVVLPECVQDLIFEMSQHEPYRLQLAGSCAYALWQKRGNELDDSHCNELTHRFNEALLSARNNQLF